MKSTLLYLFASLPAIAWAQPTPTVSLNCDHAERNGRLASHCEMREQTIPSGGRLTIDGRTNGGVTVKGWTRPDVLVRAQVRTAAASEAEARTLASQVFLQASAGRVAADGPASNDGRHWSVSYEVFVPQHSDLSITTRNGGIHVSDVQGHIEFQARNGGIHLNRLGGDVKGETTNGGVHIELAGPRWNGPGLDVRSVNGGVHVSMPSSYAARIETGTVNGSVNSNIPEMASRERRPKAVTADLGGGGPTIRVHTTNGGVHIQRTSGG